MQRRALLQTAALALLPGCAGGDDSTTSRGTRDGTGDATRSPVETSTEYEHTMVTDGPSGTTTTTAPPGGSVTGTVVTEGWTAESLAGSVDPAASTVTVEGSIRNETESSATPVAVLYDFFDAEGTELAAERVPFELTVQVVPGTTVTVLQTVELPSTDVTEIATMDLALEMDD